MNLDDLKCHSVVDPLGPMALDGPPPGVQVLDGEVEEDDDVMCGRCKVEGSLPLPNNTCDTCGAVWEPEEEEESEFMTALEHLQSCLSVMTKLVQNQRLVKKMSHGTELEIRDLLMVVDDFLEDYTGDWSEEA